jgi:integrase
MRIEGTTKSGRSRTVGIDAGTLQVLREHCIRQAEERLTAGGEWRDSDDYVFTTSRGGPIQRAVDLGALEGLEPQPSAP